MQSSIRNTLLVGVALGLLIGLGGYTFIYSKGYSYLTNNPAACANCHVMRAQYDAWLKSSHRSAATCNDCHTPHNVLGKYAVKANNGFWHSFYFTTGWYPDTIDDPAVWGKNFPMQYDLYLRTVDMQRTNYGGSEAMPHSPTQADPRSVVARSKLEQDPRLKIIWAGYSFSADYRERRGHAYMLDDQTFTERQKFAPPAMGTNCHASIVTTYLKLGNGDLIKGFNAVSDTHMTYPQIRQTVKHAVACIDCHDPATMQLRVTRPAFIEGIRALKASQGIPDYDVNTMATRQEMRSYVCGQCAAAFE